MYWAKQENPKMYNNVRQSSVEFYIEQTLERINITNLNNDSKNAVKGSGDYDIATVLHQLFKEEYVCVSVKANIWYRFKSHKWAEIDSGTTLRKSISEELRAVYTSKASKMARQLTTLEPESDKSKMLKRRIEIIGSIIDRLSRTNDKKNIMTEAKDIFFDSQFFDKMDTNPYIICFKNGVYDFKEPRGFRNGRPEDYISKCTNTNYVELSHTNLPIQEEINDFMCKLFPDPQLKKYMWEHLASTLLGTTPNQTFNTYIGVGRNGKSVLMKLMSLTLGEYKGDVPLTLLTQQRAKIGGLSPELVQLKGVRYAVIQEPSKGEKLNEGVMKQLTGGDPVQCRSPYMLKSLTFIPQFKLVVCTNNLMEVKSQDGGTWRRIRVVPFESLFTEEPDSDPDKKQFKIVNQDIMDEKCEYWKEVFASQLVQITLETMGKVADCPIVTAASNSYRDGQDIITEFIRDRTEKYQNKCICKLELLLHIRVWYNDNSYGKPPNYKEIVVYMDEVYGHVKDSTWMGCRIKPQVQKPSDDLISEFSGSDGDEESMNMADITDI
jgi:P4 family phage/plasmid primase-like protien